MTADEFAEALSRLVAEAEDAGLEPEAIMAELVGMAEAMRLNIAEQPTLLHPLPSCTPQRPQARPVVVQRTRPGRSYRPRPAPVKRTTSAGHQGR